MPILANNKIKENNTMTKNKNVKLSKCFVDYIKFVDNTKNPFNELQQSEIKLSNKVNNHLTEFTLQTIEFVSKCKVKKEIMTAKKYAIKYYAVHEQSESRINLAYRIAGSEVIRTKLKENKGNIKEFQKSIEKELEKPLSQTQLNKYKNERKVNNNKIELKGKKEKVQSTKVDIIPPAQIPYQKYSEQQLQAIIDNANNELVRRGNMTMSK